MRLVPQEMTDRWKAVMKGGDARPAVRATILTATLKRFEYDTALANGETWDNQRSRVGHFTSIIFGDAGTQRELPNIKSCTWTRSTDQDVATCTLVLQNNEIVPAGAAVPNEEEFDQPGYFTYSRGNAGANRWGHDDNGWHNIIVPDRLVKTYEGYGSDPSVVPALDENLMQSGTWLIDKVTYGDNGDITLEMRDVGRLLLDQICFPPVIPYSEYPLYWETIHSKNVEGRDVTGGSWGSPQGTALASGSQGGHKPAHALAGDDGLYWLSEGKAERNDKVYWEVNLDDNSTAMNGVRIATHGGPYRIYISLKNASGWIGKRKVPGTGEVNVPFVKSVWADRGRLFDVILPRRYGAIKKVRITFTRLHDTRTATNPWAAGLKQVQLYTAGSKASLGFGKGMKLKVVGNYGDYTHIIKWVTAWGGFFWPPPESGLSFIHLGPGNNKNVFYPHAHPSLPKGRVWGDFMRTGTYGLAKLDVDLFDKKPLMDVINYVRDIVGFYFCIDETGAVVWRMPNLWALGNYRSPTTLGDRARSRTSSVITLDEGETLYEYSTTLDSSDIRERIFVANSTGKYGTVIKGYRPFQVGFRRVAGWTDQRFASKAEARVVADLIAAQSMFHYRRGRAVIPGHTAIQVDDQVRIFERVTNETYYHYVVGITSNFDAESGEWTYTLDTHWLGENPSDAWAMDFEELDTATRNYLNAVGEDDE